jgi:CelD/BcsL family acetyltransferase involved in cellulose biosynthesis
LRAARPIPLGELEERDLAAWRELADRAVEPNPFFDPDFVLSAARRLEEWDEVAVVRVLDGGDWIACLPIRRYRRWHRLPLPHVATWLHIYCLLGTPLVAPGRESQSLEGIVAEMQAVERTAFAGLEWVSAEGALADALGEAAPEAIAFDRFSRATLVRRPSDDYLEGHVKSKDRRDFRRRARLLTEELGEEPQLVDRAGEPEAIETFLDLEASGWKGREGTAMASNPAHAELMRETAHAFAERGSLRLIFLEAAGKAVAARCSFVAGGVDFCFKIAYDESFKRFSPGRELELRMVDRFHADESLKWLDSCTDPRNDLYNRLWPDRRELTTAMLPAPGARGKLAVPAIRAAISLRDRRRRAAVD